MNREEAMKKIHEMNVEMGMEKAKKVAVATLREMAKIEKARIKEKEQQQQERLARWEERMRNAKTMEEKMLIADEGTTLGWYLNEEEETDEVE